MYSLITAALFATAAVAAPAAGTCTSRSTKVTDFQIKDFDFHASWTFTTPAHQNSWGYVNFTLARLGGDDDGVPHAAYQCTAASNWLSDFYYGNINYNCTDVAGGGAGNGLPHRGTFSYSRPDKTLAINQTWDCPEGSRFWAEGGAVLDLNCHETQYQNPNWTMGQIYSDRVITCDKLSQPVPIKSLRAAA